MAEISTISINGCAWQGLSWAIDVDGEFVAMEFFGRSAESSGKQLRYVAGNQNSIFYKSAGSSWSQRKSIKREPEKQYNVKSYRFFANAERISRVVAVQKRVGDTLIISDEDHYIDDVYNALMTRFATPIKKEWVQYLVDNVDEIKRKRAYMMDMEGRSREPLKISEGKTLNGSRLYVYDISELTEENLQNVILRGLNFSSDLSRRRIGIASKPQRPVLESDSMDDYMARNGELLKSAVEEATKPLAEINGTAANVALMNGQLFSQQGAMVNAINTLLDRRSNVFLIIGMGTGKTVISLSSVVDYYVRQALKKYPGKTVEDVYREKLYSGFAWVMCPGQLTNKWVEEASEKWFGHGKDKIIDAKVVEDFDQLTDIVAYENGPGKTAKGIRLYVISKEDAKLSYEMEPTPATSKLSLIRIPYCKQCFEQDARKTQRPLINGKLANRCPVCEGKEWFLYNERIHYAEKTSREFLDKYKDWESKPEDEKEKVRALGELSTRKLTSKDYVYGVTCPHCGNLCLKNVVKTDEKESGHIWLTEADFSKRNASNLYCMVCGESLWGPNARNLITVNGETVEDRSQESKWSNVTHYVNYNRASRTTFKSIRGHEKQVMELEKLKTPFPSGEDEVNISSAAGVRRVSWTSYIKHRAPKAGFVILDEAHKYAGETGQGHSAHELVKASKKSLCLTGTISNGMASSLFRLLWSTEPKFMRDLGYDYGAKTRFIQDFGTQECTFSADYSEDANADYGTVVKKKQIGSKNEKAGLNPLLHLYLLGMSVFLDLDDFSSGAGGNGHMPEFNEIMRLVPLDPGIEAEYGHGLDRLKTGVKEIGRSLLSKTFRFGLYYPDTPYDQKPIMNPVVEGQVVYTPPEWTEADFEAVTGGLSNKEREFLEDLKERLDAGERAFVYCEQTGKDMNITPRLKRIIVKYCGLKEDQVQVLTTAVAVSDRVSWMTEKAEKYDVRVFISNPALVDTGIDFIFTGKNGLEYNYPNLFYFQLGTTLAILWQASRRAYRLNQSKECRVYYYAYEGTMQASILELMGLKEASVSAIQSRFSSSALAAMSADLDVRVKLAETLMNGKSASNEEISDIFESAKALRNEAVCIYDGYPPAKSYWELLGIEKPELTRDTDDDDMFIFDVPGEEDTADGFDLEDILNFDDAKAPEKKEPEKVEEVKKPEPKKAAFDFSDFVLMPKKQGKKKKEKKKEVTEDFDWGFDD